MCPRTSQLPHLQGQEPTHQFSASNTIQAAFYTHTHTHTHTDTHTHTHHTHTHSLTHPCIRAQSNTHTHTHTRAHAHTHTPKRPRSGRGRCGSIPPAQWHARSSAQRSQAPLQNSPLTSEPEGQRTAASSPI